MADGVKPRLLIVDDSRVMLRMLRRLLEGTEFEVIGEAYSGREALEQYRRLAPDLVISDIVMPDMDGVKALEGILALDPSAKVVMSSSLGTKEKVLETLGKGAKSFLMKPYERTDLLRVLRAVLQPPRAAAPTAKFFGQFLLERGRINREQLLEAVRLQDAVNVKLGTLAVDRGWMTADQVKQINRLQRQVDKRFGELAVEQGLLTPRQVEELLATQRGEHLLLGEALVQRETLTAAELADELAAFRADQQGIPSTLDAIYADQPNPAVLASFADVLTKMFQRIGGEAVKAGPCHALAGLARPHDFTLSQSFRGGFAGTCTLSLTADVLMRVASRMLGEPVLEPGEVALDGAAEFLNIVNGNVCAKLSALGRPAELAPPAVHDNRAGAAFDFGGAARGGSLCITPILHPTSGIEFALVDRSGR